jgi:hypothetical protein
MTWIITPEWTSTTLAIYVGVFFVALLSGLVERKGLMSVNYSKFRTGSGMSSRLGMFIIYFVPFLAHLPAVIYFSKEPFVLPQILFSTAILIHFAKRSYESLFVHKYSGPIDASTVFQITAGYSAVSIYAAYLLPNSLKNIDALAYIGVLLFLVGQFFNFYHHKLLADLRESQTGYFIPKGALFEQVTCPHYFFEVLSWIGIALMSRQIEMFLLAVMMGSYLSGRSAKARAWYLEKFPDYPKNRKNIIPYLY